MHVRYIHHTPWWRTLTTPQRQTDRGRFACLRRIGGATPVVCCRLQVLLRVLLGVVVLLGGQLWICLYLFMLMRKKTKIKEKEPQLIKHLHAHKSFTCISYLVDFLSCRYTHRLCLFSLPCSKQNFLLLLFVSKKKEKKTLPTLKIVGNSYGTCWHLVTSVRQGKKTKGEKEGEMEEEEERQNLCLNNLQKGF